MPAHRERRPGGRPKREAEGGAPAGWASPSTSTSSEDSGSDSDSPPRPPPHPRLPPRPAEEGPEYETMFPEGCEHYRRRCRMICNLCQEVFTCRHCHNDKWEFSIPGVMSTPNLSAMLESTLRAAGGADSGHQSSIGGGPPPADDQDEPGQRLSTGSRGSVGTRGSVGDGAARYTPPHVMDRHNVTEIECMLCNKRQSVSNRCIQCGTQFGRYYCEKCHFWDQNISQKPFHCEECGLCRVGGRENFIHCNGCGTCMEAATFDIHLRQCRPDLLKTPCPLCLEDLFTTIKPISLLRCGHAVHSHCLKDMKKAGMMQPFCPVCKKSIFTAEDPRMQLFIAAIDEEIANTPLPLELRFQCDIACNDCGTHSKVEFHVIGMKCSSCNR